MSRYQCAGKDEKQMRVIAGTARGRKLNAPKSLRVRPTADRVKESLFSMLMSRLGEFEDMRVLDIFAGTGNLGIEALSRGAAYAVFIDSHPESAETIRKNLESTGFADRAKVVLQEAAGALKWLGRGEAPFHLVFLDPPYHEGHTARVLELLAESPLVDAGTTVVAEFSSKEELPRSFGKLQETERRIYGDSALSFLTITDRGAQCP
jgi:16S rRNA (guanine966-N2)-methyltransferase